MVRQVVTGESADGKAHVYCDSVAEFSLVAENFKFAQLWGSDSPPKFPQDGERPEATALMPGPGGYRYVLMRIEPGHAGSSVEPEAELFSRPGVDSPDGADAGMHRTDTVDLGVVLSGVVAMEMEDGNIIELKRGDVFVQNGTYHKWSNPGNEPCEVVVTLIGGIPRT